MDDSIIEVQVPIFGTATPTGALVAYGDFAHGNPINSAPVLDALTDKGACCFFVF